MQACNPSQHRSHNRFTNASILWSSRFRLAKWRPMARLRPWWATVQRVWWAMQWPQSMAMWRSPGSVSLIPKAKSARAPTAAVQKRSASDWPQKALSLSQADRSIYGAIGGQAQHWIGDWNMALTPKPLGTKDKTKDKTKDNTKDK